jgi:hypothetical protein
MPLLPMHYFSPASNHRDRMVAPPHGKNDEVQPMLDAELVVGQRNPGE